jgi:hypothetical protein
MLMILRAVESIGGAEDGRWKEREQDQWRAGSSEAMTVIAYSGWGRAALREGDGLASLPRENFGSLEKH